MQGVRGERVATPKGSELLPAPHPAVTAAILFFKWPLFKILRSRQF